MKKSIKTLLIPILAAVMAPTSAHAALTMEFYTYGGHDAVVSAFNRAALIFGAGDYQSLFGVLATASLAAAVVRIVLAVAFGSRDLHGGQNYATGALVPWLITCGIFMISIIPKGTLHIYDPVENKYQAVGGVPDIIILFAGVTNKIERAMVDLVSTSGDPIGYQSQAGGKGFLGLYKSTTAPIVAADPLLDQTLNNFISDCVYLEASMRPGYVQELRRDTTDLWASLGKSTNPAAYTTVYDSTLSPQGEAKSCLDAYNNIQTRLNAANALKNNFTGICAELGFDPGNASSYNDCLNRMGGVVSTQLNPDKNSMDFLRSAYIAQSMDAVFSGDNAATGYANFSILNKASGTMTTINQWLPTIRAVILAVTVALTPFLSLLMLTPLMPRAVKFVLGSFLLLTVWGVVDAVIHQFIIDYSNRVYGEIRQYNLSLDALRFFPSATEKTLAMFGMVRASGLALAAIIATSVIGIGSSVAGSVGGKLMGDVTATGAQAEQQMLDPGSKAAVRRSNQMAIPTESLANNYSFAQRTGADFAQQMGQLESISGGVEAAGGLGGWGNLQHGQGYTNAYRGQGDVALNKQFMAQAESMGIPQAAAQQMAAATVNHGEGLAELRRLQQQGYTGQQAADTYWQGKTVDHMQGKSIGQQDGFSMYRPTAGQETGRWGQVNATWQNGEMVGLQGNSVSVVDTESMRAGYDKSFGQALSEVHKAEQSVGEGITKSWGNSGTWSQVTAAAQQLYTATSGTVDWSKSLNSTVVSSLRNSTAVDERTGQTIDKSAWAQITAGAGTPTVSPIKASIEGGASWRVTTSDGKSYTVHQSADQARSTQEQIGQSWRTTSTQVRSGNYSSTAQKALASIESVTGTRTASESASRSYQMAHDINERRNQALSRAAETRSSLDRDFYSYIGQQQFGGGAAGDRQAIKYVEGLAANGKTNEINKLREQYYEARGINPETLGQGLPEVAKPDTQAIIAAVAPVDAKIDATSSELKQDLQSQPNLKPNDPTRQVSAQLQTKPGAVDPKEIQQSIADNKQLISEGKTVINSKGQEIKSSPVEKLHSAAAEAGKKSGELTLQAADAWNNSVPGQITNGLVDAVPKVRDGLNTLSSTDMSDKQLAAEATREPAASQPAQEQSQERKPEPQHQATTQQLAAEAIREPASSQSAQEQPLEQKPEPLSDRPGKHQTLQPLPPKRGL